MEKELKEILKLQILVFVAGFILMAIEIVGGRLLTPYYGGSVYIWGSVIGLFLAGLSIGYYAGGFIADRRPENSVLSGIIFGAAVFILLVPLIYTRAINLFAGLPVSIAPLLACCTLFLIPSILLGIISPFAIKMYAKDFSRLGNISGKLSSISTLGSVVGTFLTTFMLLSIFPLKLIFVLFGVGLIICAMMFVKRKDTCVLLFLIIVIVALLTTLSGGNKPNINSNEYINVTFESLYGRVDVIGDSDYRSLYINGGVMGSMDTKNKTNILPGWEYITCFKNAFVVKKDIKNVLMIGLGAGLLPNQIREYYPDAHIDSVDINPTVIDFAQKYFQVKPDDKLKLIESDGRTFLDKSTKKYDLIAVDAYKFKEVYKIPQQLATQEFFESAKNHLNEGGIFASMYVAHNNVFEESEFHKAEYKTIKSVFDNVYIWDCETQVVFSSVKPLDVSSIKDTPAGIYYEPNEANMNLSNVKILTDEYYPVNILETTGE